MQFFKCGTLTQKWVYISKQKILNANVKTLILNMREFSICNSVEFALIFSVNMLKPSVMGSVRKNILLTVGSNGSSAKYL